MKKSLLTLLVAFIAVLSASAQTTFEWGTATWNIENGKSYADIQQFKDTPITLTYPNPNNYTLTLFNVVAIDYDVFVDDNTEAIATSSTAQGKTAVEISYAFVEGHSYKLNVKKAYLVQVNIATRTADTLSVNNDAYSISFSIAGPELVKTIETEGTMALTIIDQNYQPTFSVVNAAEICTALGINNISEATVYGLNPDGSYNEFFMSAYDGWRDVEAQYTKYQAGWDATAKRNATPAVYSIKLNETADTIRYYFYDTWAEYDPNAPTQTGGSTVGARPRKASTSYNKVIWDWDNGDGTTTKYTRTYRVDEGTDYKASFILIANKKAVRINSTLHFVSQESYIALNTKKYEGYLASGISMAAQPGTSLADLSEAETVSVAPTATYDKVNVTFSAITIPMLNLAAGSQTILAVKTVNEDGSISYSAESVTVAINMNGMSMPYTATLVGTQASADAFPTFTLTLAQANVVTAIFAQTKEEAENARSAYYTTITGIDAPATSKDSSVIYNINGARQTSVTKGLNIINSKKVIVK